MGDGRKNNGGKREGSGRPTKSDEKKVQKLSIGAIINVYGSEEKYFQHIAKQSKESFPHLNLIQQYGYGKPKETTETTHIIDKPMRRAFLDFNEQDE